MVLPAIQRLLPVFGFLLVTTGSFAQLPNRFDVVIDELLPDPTPPVQLPNTEFIELKNVSTTAFNIRNWKLSDGTTTATIAANFILKPDSFVIVCPNSAAPLFTPFGATIGVSNFPSLNNDIDVIALYAADGRLIHAVGYNTSWYQNAVKSEGGWSLEMIDTRNPCTGINNWKASSSNTGGTPGKKNAVEDNNPDDQPPALIRTTTTDSLTISALFEEPMDSLSAVLPENYTINSGMAHPVTASIIMPLCTEVVLKLTAPLNTQTVYELTANNVKDCAGNNINQLNTAKAGSPVMAESLAVVINELLFNPLPGGYDYVEIYNRSNQVIDLKQLYLATRNVTRQLTGIAPISATSWLLFPGEYLVFTENKFWLQQQYLVKDPSLIMELPALPSLPDDKGTIVLMNIQGAVIDELQYEHSWHFGLINNEEGIALERLNYNLATQDRSNWSSAASTAGFGTPGYPNSQLIGDREVQGQVVINPAVFSPDNDGFNDFAVIDYELAAPGFVANIRIYDTNGRLVRYLVQNATLSATGRFRWDGLGDKLNKLPIGTYVVFTELFNGQGKVKKFKQVVTLARRF
ncbi:MULTISPECIES: lamin tail domain-containing protein [Niastella]|uniref:Lamin tail domain-containing protein n=1 Tax=Niastella soli TaxID=2821487 RepID=A0ABS3YNJ0_9BACT|nr:lamin tail domain-containing protein [Niastella soli]MBO9199462.1 lamin tail domain-containing protein [Niastella soli]